MTENPRPPDDKAELNTPAEMLVRAGYLGWVGSVPTSLILLVAGIASGHLILSLVGVAVFSGGWALREWLRRRGDMDPPAAAWESLAAEGRIPDDAHVASLLALLQEWETLEQQRGSPGFDPWALQVVRNNIRAEVEKDPALLCLFQTLRRAA